MTRGVAASATVRQVPRPLRSLARIAVAGIVLTVLLAVPTGSSAATCAPGWVGSWLASPSDASTGRGELRDQTLRMIVRPHLAGTTIRIRLDDRFGSGYVAVGPVTVARRDQGASVVASSLRPVTFGGSPTATIGPGASVTSDPVSIDATTTDDLAISVAVSGTISSPSEHLVTRQTSYISSQGTGDRTSQAGADGFGPTAAGSHTSGWYLLGGVDVLTAPRTAAVVAFGDSITDGFVGARSPLVESFASIDTNTRYPDFLQRRLDAAGIPLSVLNAGISSNQLLASGPAPQAGPAGVDRFAADALAPPGVTDVIVLEGINDIGIGLAGANQLIAGYERLITLAHAAGVRIHLGTLTPSGGTTVSTYDSPLAERPRQAVNAWIRGQKLADSVVDFDAAVRDPANGSRLAPQYDGSDHLHLNAAGSEALAGAVDLATLVGKTCTPASLSLRVTPTKIHAGRRTRLTARVSAVVDGVRQAVAGATVKVGGLKLTTNAEGVARGTVRFRFRRTYRASAVQTDYTTAKVSFRVVR